MGYRSEGFSWGLQKELEKWLEKGAGAEFPFSNPTLRGALKRAFFETFEFSCQFALPLLVASLSTSPSAYSTLKLCLQCQSHRFAGFLRHFVSTHFLVSSNILASCLNSF